MGDSMSSMVLSGDTSGTVTVTVPAVAGTNTATLPAATGTVMVSGNMPAFSVYSNASTAIPTSTFTKIALQVKASGDNSAFDTNGYFDATTNYRFTPLIAGYYQISGSIQTLPLTGIFLATIYKNGNEFKRGTQTNQNSNANQVVVSALIYLNGSTDYVELFGYQNGGSTVNTNTANSQTYFTGVMVRGS